MSAARFLGRLFEPCSEGVVEVRAKQTGRRAWTELGAWARLRSFVVDAIASRQDVYVSLATRRDTSSGTAENLCQIGAVYSDLDMPPEKARRILEDFPFPYGLLVASGLGAQAFWPLREPLDGTTPADVHRAASLQRRLAAYLGGDDRATSPAATPRLVGTVNWKYGSGRPVRLLDETDATVNPSELEDFLPAEVVVRNAMTIRSSIPVGERNDQLYALVRSLRCRGLAYGAIVEAVRSVNEKVCEAPLPDGEVRKLIVHAWKQPDRVTFVRPSPVHVQVQVKAIPAQQDVRVQDVQNVQGVQDL